MDKKKELNEEDFITYRKLVESAESRFHNRYRGTSVTHYIHCAFYHHEELQKECQQNGKTLTWYEQQGWEAMNKVDTTFIERHTTKGASVGRHLKEDKKRKIEELLPEKEPLSPSKNYNEKEDENLTNSFLNSTVVEIQQKLKERGLSTSGTKRELVARVVVDIQRENIKNRKQMERKEDPMKYKKWWNASIIVALFKKEARSLTRSLKEN